MAAQWFYQAGGQVVGPVSAVDLRWKAAGGEILPDTLVREGAEGGWVRAERVRGLFQRSTPPPSPSLGASRPPPLPLPSPVPESGAPDTDFDPYHQWLGIHPTKRPLNHYILLGIAEEEDDPNVIASAADRQMAHVRVYHTGEHVEACQKLLNELARARVCLLDPTKKAAYDRALQRAQSAVPPPVPRLSISQVQQEAELARRRRADCDHKPTGLPPVQGSASGSAVQSRTLNEFGRYVLATAACGAILLLYVTACVVFEWKRGGGAIPMLMFLGAMTATWKAITRGRRRRNEQIPESPSPDEPQTDPLPQPSPVPESGAPRRAVSGEGSIRHGVPAAAVNEAAEKPERIWPVTWVVIIVGSGTMLLLLWALVFRGGSAPQQEANKDQPRSVAAQPAKGTSATADPWAEFSPAPRGYTVPEGWTSVAPPIAPPLPVEPPPEAPSAAPTGHISGPWDELPIEPPPPGWQDKTTPAPDPAADSKSRPATGGVKVLELADLAELVGPSVVQVNVTRPEEAATGSGFVLDKQGTIVTNYHVIEDATAGRIIFSDKTSAPITGYLGAWPEKDIALVRVECPPDKLHPLRLATSAPRQGERVAAFGSPLGLQQSVSEGIVSAVRESKELRALGPIDVNALLIQTTTPISSGNSGGPLVDMKGMVVGINTWTFRPLGGENVNFAVAAVELPPLLLAKNGSPSPLPANAPGAAGVRRILSRTWDHVHAGEYDRAIADCTQAIRLDPKHAGAYSLRGLAYYLKRDYDRAIADYTEAIRLDPKSAVAYSWRGEAYRRKADYDRAIADYTQAIRLDPKDASAYSGRAFAYNGKDDYDRAIADFTEAIRLDPKNASAYRGRAFAYHYKHDYDSVIADFTQGIRLDPKNADAYHFRGLTYQAKGQHAAAERDFAQAKKLGYKPPAPVPPPGYKVWSPADTEIPPPPGRRSAPIVEEPQREVGERRAVVSAWRRLRLGMSPAQVEKLLGRANDVQTYPALGRMTWDYRYPDRISRYEGHIEFSQNGVSGWSEPMEWAKD